jgi:hypothetical protein
MITQREKLNADVIALQEALEHATRFQDAFVQVELFKKLEIAKSILLNLD